MLHSRTNIFNARPMGFTAKYKILSALVSGAGFCLENVRLKWKNNKIVHSIGKNK